MLSALGLVPAFYEASGDLGPLPPGGSHPSRSQVTPNIQLPTSIDIGWKGLPREEDGDSTGSPRAAIGPPGGRVVSLRGQPPGSDPAQGRRVPAAARRPGLPLRRPEE